MKNRLKEKESLKKYKSKQNITNKKKASSTCMNWSVISSVRNASTLPSPPSRGSLLIQLRRVLLLSELVVESDSINLLPKLLVVWSLRMRDLQLIKHFMSLRRTDLFSCFPTKKYFLYFEFE